MAEDKRYDLKVTGRAARPRSKRLRDAGMSVQPGSTVVVGGVEGLEGKLDKYIFDDLFEKVEIREGVYAIRAKYGLFTNEFLSAKGIDEGDEGGTGGASYLGQLVNVGAWADQTPAYDRIMVQLAGSTHWTEKRLDEIGGGLDEEQLAAYLTENNYAKTGDIPSLDGYATETWVTGRGYITSAALNGYATQSWVVGKGYATTSDLDARIDALVNGAPAAFDTLKEIADVLQGNVDSIGDILTTLGTKADKSISILAGTGLAGGGTLSANRTLSLKPATTSALGGIIVGDRLSIDSSGRLTATYTYTHPSATATTIAAATGKVLSAITVNSLGHVTSVAAKTLAAADIPSLAISKITGLQAELDKKLDKSVLDDLFEKVEIREGVYAIRAKYGLFTNEFLSAKGMDEGSESPGGGATKLSELTDVSLTNLKNNDLLRWNGTRWVNVPQSSISPSLAWENITGKPSTFPPSAHTHTKSQITDFPATWAWGAISGKPTTLSGYGITDGVNDVTVSGSGNAVTGASISGHKLTLTKGSTFLLSSAYTANDILTKLKTVDGAGSGLDADTLDGYHGSSDATGSTYVLRTSTGGIITKGVEYKSNYYATPKSAGWYRFFKFASSNANGASAIIHIDRLYYYPSNESYTFAINVSFGTGISITQLSGFANSRLITKIRVNYVNSGDMYVDFYYDSTSYFSNIVYCYGSGRGNFQTPELVSTSTGSNYEFKTGNGFVCNEGINGVDMSRIFYGKGNKPSGLMSSVTGSGCYSTTGSLPDDAPDGAYGYGNFVIFDAEGSSANGGAITQIYFPHRNESPYYRTTYERNAGMYIGWYKLARTTDNVASASKLETAHTINGTSFDGTANITTSNWGTARSVGIVNSDGTGTAVTVSVNGGANVNLKLPATIKASLTGNAATATTLQTARTIWGQSFNGSANVSGAISGATTINASGAVTFGRTLAVTGAVTLKSTLAVTGLITATAGLTTPQYLQVGDGRIYWDATNKALYVKHKDGITAIGFYAQGWMSAKGVDSGTGGSTGGGNFFGVNVNGSTYRVDDEGYVTIPDYPTSLNWADISGKPSTFPPLAHTHTKSQITDFPTTWAWGAISGKPTTLSGYGITDGVNDVTVSGRGNAVTAASISGHKLTLTKGNTFLLSSAYTANDIITKLKTVDGEDCELDADLLDGYHGSESATANTYVLRTSTGSIATKAIEYKSNYYATPKAKGWYRIFKFSTSNANGASAIIHIDRLYYSPSNESYTFAVNMSFGTGISITQLSGYANERLITKLRVDYTNSGDAFIDFYYDTTSYFNNIIYCYGSGRGSFQTPTLVSEATGSVYEFETTNGIKSDRGFDGNAYSATKLQTSCTINGTSFDGTKNITTVNWGTARNISIQDATAAHTGTAVSVNGGANVILKLPATISASIVGNASSATKLQTARTINGTSFDGSANITTSNWGTARSVGIVNSDGTGTAVTVSVNGGANVNLKLPATIKAALTGNATTATTLQTARTIWGQSFNGSKNVSGAISGATTINASGAVTFGSTLAVTGAVTLKSALSVSGLITATAGLTTPQYLQVGDGRIYWDATNKALYVKGSDGTAIGFYSNGWMSAKGAGSETGGTGGGGISGEIDTLTFSRGVNDRQMVLTNGCSIRWLTAKGSWAGSVTVYNNAGNTSLWSVSGAYGGQDSIIYSYYGGTSYSSPAMVITKAMNVGIGTTSPTSKLHVNGNITANNVSDIRLKTIVKEEANYCHKLLSLGLVVDFYYNDKAIQRNTGAVDKEKHTGLIYQSAKELGLPNFCHTDDDGYGAINYLCTDYINLIAGALQQTIVAQETIEQRVDRLERENEELKRQLNNLTAA